MSEVSRSSRAVTRALLLEGGVHIDTSRGCASSIARSKRRALDRGPRRDLRLRPLARFLRVGPYGGRPSPSGDLDGRGTGKRESREIVARMRGARAPGTRSRADSGDVGAGRKAPRAGGGSSSSRAARAVRRRGPGVVALRRLDRSVGVRAPGRARFRNPAGEPYSSAWIGSNAEQSRERGRGAYSSGAEVRGGLRSGSLGEDEARGSFRVLDVPVRARGLSPAG